MRVTGNSLSQGREQLGGRRSPSAPLPASHQWRTCALGVGVPARPTSDLSGRVFHSITCHREFQQLLGLRWGNGNKWKFHFFGESHTTYSGIFLLFQGIHSLRPCWSFLSRKVCWIYSSVVLTIFNHPRLMYLKFVSSHKKIPHFLLSPAKTVLLRLPELPFNRLTDHKRASTSVQPLPSLGLDPDGSVFCYTSRGPCILQSAICPSTSVRRFTKCSCPQIFHF